MLDPGGLLPIRADVVAHFAASIPRPDTGTGSWEVNDRIGTVGTGDVLEAAAAGDVRRVVAYSVVWVHGDHGDDWITEDTPDRGPGRPKSCRLRQGACAPTGTATPSTHR